MNTCSVLFSSPLNPLSHDDLSKLSDFTQIRNLSFSIRPSGYCNVTSFEPDWFFCFSCI
jgi:hypothetical protein